MPALNVKDGVAVKGYDPVAYFNDGKPVKGLPEHTFEWQGATWQFVSAEHRSAFMREPTKYAPQYGGYCAFAISSACFALYYLRDLDTLRYSVD